MESGFQFLLGKVMATFDAFKKWAILFPPNAPSAEKAVKDLSRCIGLLRGHNGPPLEIIDATVSAPPDTTSVIVLNCANGSPERNGYSWRTGATRVEIYGESEHGLCNGIYDFLSAFGIGWPEPDYKRTRFNDAREVIPHLQESRIYQLEIGRAHEPSFPDEDAEASVKRQASFKRYVIPGKKNSIAASPKKLEFIACWAVRNKFDVLVFPFYKLDKAIRNGAEKQLASHGLSLEAGGWTLSSLVPRKMFLFHRELFRMEGGKRRKKINFCPTTPETIEVIKTESKKLFLSCPSVRFFNLWPDRGEEKNWCSCPSCRAFSPADQNRIAVNAAADVLAEINKDAFITYYEKNGGTGTIQLRPNVFKIEGEVVTANEK